MGVLYLEEDSLDFAAVFPHFLIHHRVEDVFGGDAGVGDALVIAHHPDEHIWDAVLRLEGKGPVGEWGGGLLEANMFYETLRRSTFLPRQRGSAASAGSSAPA